MTTRKLVSFAAHRGLKGHPDKWVNIQGWQFCGELAISHPLEHDGDNYQYAKGCAIYDIRSGRVARAGANLHEAMQSIRGTLKTRILQKIRKASHQWEAAPMGGDHSVIGKLKPLPKFKTQPNTQPKATAGYKAYDQLLIAVDAAIENSEDEDGVKFCDSKNRAAVLDYVKRGKSGYATGKDTAIVAPLLVFGIGTTTFHIRNFVTNLLRFKATISKQKRFFSDKALALNPTANANLYRPLRLLDQPI